MRGASTCDTDSSTLILEEYPKQNTHFLDENGITFFQYGIPGNKEPFVQSACGGQRQP